MITNKNSITRYINDIRHSNKGNNYLSLMQFFFPELITALVLYIGLSILDSYFISCLQDCTAYTTLGLVNLLFHFLIKVAEGLSTGIVILCGSYNGSKEYKKAGKSLIDAFWSIFLLGGIISLCLYLNAHHILNFYNVPKDTFSIAIPFLKLKSIGVFILFIYLASIGFLRSIKNPRIAMIISFIGAGVFILVDWVCIFGKFGMPSMGLLGSSVATICQYLSMCLLSLYYIFFSTRTRKYDIKLFTKVRLANIFNLLKLSIPIIIDKAILAICTLWLAKLMTVIAQNHMASNVIKGSFFAIKDIERFALMPGVAFAQVITFLISNDFKKRNWDDIKINIKKTLFMSVLIVSICLLIICLFSRFFVHSLDKANIFTDFAVSVIPFISILVVFDMIQLVLSAALRGTANVKVVMWTRLITCIFLFIPTSYFLAHMQIKSMLTHFILLYSSLYLAHMVMCYVYIQYLKTDKWKVAKYI